MQQERFEDPLKVIIREQQDNYGEALRQTTRCRFPGPPNRYGVHPGYMWDGVDRGNGYESRFLEKMVEANNQDKREYLDHAKHL